MVDRDLAASQTDGLVNDWQFNIAYNAALQLATAALAVCGYEADRSNHHYRVIHSLALTVGVDPATIQTLDTCRKKRNISDYERAGAVSDVEVDSLRRIAVRLRKQVADWIATNHPDLSPKGER